MPDAETIRLAKQLGWIVEMVDGWIVSRPMTRDEKAEYRRSFKRCR